MRSAQFYCLICVTKYYNFLNNLFLFVYLINYWIVRLTWLVDMLKVFVARVERQLDLVDVPSFATRCLKKIIIHCLNYKQLKLLTILKFFKHFLLCVILNFYLKAINCILSFYFFIVFKEICSIEFIGFFITL